MTRWVCLLLVACNNGGLGSSSNDLGLDTAHCADLHDATSCDARADCFARMSGDLPCNNSSCTNHFVECVAAPPLCAPTGVCNAACTTLTPTCRAGDVPTFQGCCPNGCVAAQKCGGSCTSDAECGAQSYCRGSLSACNAECQLTIGVPTTGICHRNCVDKHCACVDDSDCPGFFTSCDLATHTCKSLSPPVCHAMCPAGCTDSSDTQYGEICLCSQCP